MRSGLILLILFIFRVSSLAEARTTSLPRGFETGDFSGWDISRLSQIYSGEIVTDGPRQGHFCARFELRSGDFTHNGHRAEISDEFYAQDESHYLYSFSVYVPLDIPMTPDNRCIIAQWHDQDMGVKLPSVIHSPPLSISLNLNELEVKLCLSDDSGKCTKKNLFTGKIRFGEWQDFAFDIRWSRGATGRIHGWLDGRKIISYNGADLNKRYSAPQDNLGPYMKLGIYCAKGPSAPLVIYHDNYSRTDLRTN